MIPRLKEAAADPRVRGAPLAVYAYLADELDPVRYKSVKVATLARALYLKDVTCAWALKRLVSDGYLERSGNRRRWTYRIVWSASDRMAG
ncbi:MAG: hypothetical protein ACR2KM_08755 [Gemmatimonadaceae bacterium]